ncbi:chorismate synthase [Mesoaciditoga sp.]
MIKILTSGDSHGYGLFGIVEGFPAHFKVNIERINRALFSRQHVYGRGQRMKLESDHIQILSGLWEGETTGAPLTFFIKNRSTTPPNGKSTAPRPGHADFAGMIKYDFEDARVTTERSSSRRTAMDVAIGEFFRQALEELGVKIWAYTQSIGKIESKAESVRELSSQAHPLLCPDNEAEKMMMSEIDGASENGYTLGGKVKALAQGLPVGLGTFNSYENRLTSLIAKSLFDIPSVKGIVYGDIDKTYKLNGMQALDEIGIDGQRKTNHAGGIEGGMSNGEKVEITLFVKPVPTQRKGLKTVDFKSGEAVQTSYVRSDTCVVGAVSIIAQAKLSTVIFKEMMNEFGGSTFQEMKERVENYRASRKWGIFREKK